MIFIKAPPICFKEIEYVCDQVFRKFLGMKYELEFVTNLSFFEISYSSAFPNIRFPTQFFEYADANWLGECDKEFFSSEVWNFGGKLFGHSLPFDHTYIYFGSSGYVYEDEIIKLNFDILGAIFFLLSSYEEGLIRERDIHGRFLAKYSISRTGQQIELPLVNHYVEILRALLYTNTNNSHKQIQRNFSLKISCDVDYPFEQAGQSLIITGYRIAQKIIKLNFIEAKRYYLNYIFSRKNIYCYDSNYNALMFICEELEKRNLTGIFYFIPDKTSGFDLRFDRENFELLDQAKLIADRGHDIGFHPGYKTSKSQIDFCSSLSKYLSNFSTLQDSFDTLQCRFHYLRFDPTTDIDIYNSDLKIKFTDSSLSYPDIIGFRNGICWSYDMFDLKKRQTSGVIQRPLIAMDVSMFSPSYMGLNEESALTKLKQISSQTQSFDGEMMVLFHNNQLVNKSRKDLFTSFLDFHSVTDK